METVGGFMTAVMVEPDAAGWREEVSAQDEIARQTRLYRDAFESRTGELRHRALRILLTVYGTDQENRCLNVWQLQCIPE